MASLNLTIKDAVFNAALATYPGATDAERLAALKAGIKADLRGRIRAQAIRDAQEAANRQVRDALDALDVTLGPDD